MRNSLQRVFFILLFQVIVSAKAFSTSDTLLVYFSDDASVNQLYAHLLQSAFPNMKLVSIKNIEDFNHYIPKLAYENRTSIFGIRNYDEKDFMAMGSEERKREVDRMRVDSTFSDSTKTPVSYYFFDISSKAEKHIYYEYIGKISVPKVYWPLIHTFNLVHYDGKRFKVEKEMKLSINVAYARVAYIPMFELNNASDWLNPLFLILYCHQFLGQGVLEQTAAISPCELKFIDTIYICDILSPRNMLKGYKNVGGEFRTANHVDFFERTHFKLGNIPFSETALIALVKKQHFYFFFFNNALKQYSIIDALTMQIVYFEKATSSLQKKKDIRDFSLFDKKCK